MTSENQQATPTTRRALLGAAPAIAAAALPAAAAVQHEDPIFAAITAHVAALKTVQALDDESNLSDERLSELCDLEADALGELLHTMPTTPSGVVALLQHLGRTHHASEEGASILFYAHDCGWHDIANEWPLRLAAAVAAIACVQR